MTQQVQLITYVDRLSAGGIPELERLLEGPLKGLFGGVHLLPFFDPIDGADAGFDPSDHTRVDPRLGNWQDVRALGQHFALMSDLIVNHISSASPQFRDYLQHGKGSAFDGLFLTREKVFGTRANEQQLQQIYRPRPGAPFTAIKLADGSLENFWTTFTASQIDIDATHPLGHAYLDGIMRTFADNAINMIRLDAVGYAIKKAATSCFMLPETFEYIAQLSARIRELGMSVLVEIHSHYLQQIAIAQRVDRVYDFALPPLVLHAFYFRTADALKHWLQIRPANAVTVLDTHDGIGIIDIGGESTKPGLVPDAELDQLVEYIHAASGGQSRQATGSAASNLDLYQVNCTYFDALGRDELKYLLARAIQFFTPGIPQVYYVGLLAGSNDMDLLERSGTGRDINRHYYAGGEVEREMQRPVVKNLCALIRLRNTHPAFQGTFTTIDTDNTTLAMHWRKGDDIADLKIDFSTLAYTLCISDKGQVHKFDLQQNG